jgi:hypothetical protein
MDLPEAADPYLATKVPITFPLWHYIVPMKKPRDANNNNPDGNDAKHATTPKSIKFFITQQVSTGPFNRAPWEQASNPRQRQDIHPYRRRDWMLIGGAGR